MIPLFQQRDFGEKINATFTYVGQQIRSLGLSLLYIAGPVTLATGIAGGIYQSNLLKTMSNFNSSQTDVSTLTGLSMMQNVFSPAYWLLIFFSLLSYVVVSLTVYCHLKVYARLQGGPVPVNDVWQEVQASLLPGLMLTFAVAAATMLSFILFILPGLYVGVALSLALAVLVFEGKDVGAAFSRCFTLIRGHWWSTFGLLVIMGIIAAIMGAAFSIPAAIVGFMSSSSSKTDLSAVAVILAQTLATVGQQLLSALVVLALGFQYFSLVEQQEGVGLLADIDSIGTPLTPLRRPDENE